MSLFNQFGKGLALMFVGFSLYSEHIKHNTPDAILMIGWAILCCVAGQDND